MRGRTPLARMHAVRLDGAAGTNVSTPDHADLDIIGDLSLRCAFVLARNPVAANGTPLAKWTTSTSQRSYRMNLLTTGIPRVEMSSDGTGLTYAIPATTVLPTLRGLLLKTDLDVDDGAGHTAGSYALKRYRPGGVLQDLTADFGWLPHGTNPQIATPNQTIHAGSALVTLGSNEDGTQTLPCRIIAAVIKNGIDGTTVAEFDASRMRVGDRTYTDRFGKVWTLNGTAHIAAA